MARFFVSADDPPLELDDASLTSSTRSRSGRTSTRPGADVARRDAPDHQARRRAADHHARPRHHRACAAAAMSPDPPAPRSTVPRQRLPVLDVFGEDGDWGVKDEGWGNSLRASTGWSRR